MCFILFNMIIANKGNYYDNIQKHDALFVVAYSSIYLYHARKE